MITQYTTLENERWCDIAQKAYGDSKQVSLIINANPTIQILDILPGGLIINIPIIESSYKEINPTNLPPWKK